MNDVPLTACALVIGAKAPVPGTVKTRLGRTIGHERAARLYHAFLRDIAARFVNEQVFTVFWAYAPDTANWRDIIGVPSLAFPQEGADWTARQRNIFTWTAARGYAQTVLIASDSPQLSQGTVRDAFRALAENDAVLLPTYDGGYSLIGQRRGVDILGDIPMSTRTVYHDMRLTAANRGITVGTMAPTWDVDEEADLPRLVQHLTACTEHDMPATANALVQLALLPARTGQLGGLRLAGGAA